MDRAAEGLVESVIKNLRECLNPFLGTLCTSPGQWWHSPSWVFTSADCLALQAASPAQLCNYRDHFTCLASHPSLPCLHGTESFVPCSKALSILGNTRVQWPQTRCSSTLNQPLTVGPHCSFRCCPSWSISSKPSVINDSSAVKWFSFPSSKNGTVWILICKSAGNLGEGEGDRFHLDYVVGIPLEVAPL